MAGVPKLGSIERRKQVLLERSAALRASLDGEWREVDGWVGRLKRGGALLRQTRSLWLLAAPLLGLLLGRRRRGAGRMATRLAWFWGLARGGWAFWKGLQAGMSTRS